MPCVRVISVWRARLSTTPRTFPHYLPTTTAQPNRSKYSIENSIWYKGSNQSYVNEWSCLYRPNLNDGDVDHLTYNEMNYQRRHNNYTIPPRDLHEFDEYIIQVKKDVIRRIDACKEGNATAEYTVSDIIFVKIVSFSVSIKQLIWV